MSGSVAITIGNFDGVHLGHRRLVAEARDAVGADGHILVLAFDPHPATLLRPEAAPARLGPFARRVELLKDAGADEVRALVPTPELLAQEPEAFVSALVQEHRPAIFVEGPDFRFGRERAGSVETLRALEGRYGYSTRVVDPVSVPLDNGQVVIASSSIVRTLIERGRVRGAAAVLGRSYDLTGRVVRGDQRGRTIGVPTANLEAGIGLLPADGIYAGRACRREKGRETWYAAAVSVGTKPTFGEYARTCEAHLIGYSGPVDDYGWTMHLEIADWLRDQVRYDDVDLMVEQIGRDIAQTETRYAAVGAQ